MSKRLDIGVAEFRLDEARPLQMIPSCDWFVGENEYSETGCGNSGWLDPTFRFCPFCGEEIRIIQEDEDDDE